MNCERGDLAIITCGAAAGNIVKCIRLANQAREAGTKIILKNVWYVKWRGTEVSSNGNPLGVLDDELAPLRYTKGQDETIKWAGRPGAKRQGGPRGNPRGVDLDGRNQ